MKNTIHKDLITAMKAKDGDTTTVLRSIKTAITNAEKAQGDKPLTDLEILQIVRKQIKQREDAMESFSSGGRIDLYNKEKAEQQILEKYLPKSLTNEELDEIIEAVTEELQAITKKDMGRVIKLTLERVEGRVDNKTISKRVGEILQ